MNIFWRTIKNKVGLTSNRYLPKHSAPLVCGQLQIPLVIDCAQHSCSHHVAIQRIFQLFGLESVDASSWCDSVPKSQRCLIAIGCNLSRSKIIVNKKKNNIFWHCFQNTRPASLEQGCDQSSSLPLPPSLWWWWKWVRPQPWWTWLSFVLPLWTGKQEPGPLQEAKARTRSPKLRFLSEFVGEGFYWYCKYTILGLMI